MTAFWIIWGAWVARDFGWTPVLLLAAFITLFESRIFAAFLFGLLGP